MSKFFLGDLKRQTLRFFSDDVNMFLNDNKMPHKLIEKLIKQEMKRQGVKVEVKADTDKDIIIYIKDNNIITTAIAIKEGFIKQSIQLQSAIMRITSKGMDIKCIADKKPYVYYYGITEREARNRTKKDNSWKNQPRVKYGGY